MCVSVLTICATFACLVSEEATGYQDPWRCSYRIVHYHVSVGTKLEYVGRAASALNLQLCL